MCLDSYAPRRPEESLLHELFREHLATFLAETRDADSGGLPRHVVRELEAFVACGVLAHGFVRVRCPACRAERLVGFSCKGRGFCPSCAGRRMSQAAAHLVDHVLPPGVPLRQWVLSLPRWLRYVLAYDAERTSAVLRVAIRALFVGLRRRMGLAAGRGGAVSFLQRFGGSLNLNVHFHVLAIDGLYTRASLSAPPRFHPLPGLSELDVAEIEQAMVAKILGLCRRRGWMPDEVAGAMATSQDAAGAASIALQVAFGPRRGRPVRRVGALPGFLLEEDDSEVARLRPHGFSLFASPATSGRDRTRVERLIRYMARGAISLERLSRRSDGLYAYELRTPWRDGTTHVAFAPLELLEKLSALIPPKGMHLVRYHGVLAPSAAWRSDVVPKAAVGSYVVGESAGEDGSGAAARRGRWRWIPWADLMKRVHALDVLCCPSCGGRMVILAYLTQPSVVEAILAARGLPTLPLPMRAARRQAVFEM
jgi:hypothetical protein